MRISTGGRHIPYMVSIIKNKYFPIFHPKMLKIALHSVATSKSYNSRIVEDTCTLFAPNWRFLGSDGVIQTFPRLTHVAIVTSCC